MSEQKTTDMSQHFYRASAADFMKIPGSPVAYWLPNIAVISFTEKKLSDIGITRRGLQTGDKDKFIRYWHECSYQTIDTSLPSKSEAKTSLKKWFPFNNGGDYRKWFGNLDLVVNWENNGKTIKSYSKSIIPSESLYFKDGVCWPRLGSGVPCFRLQPNGYIPGDLSPCFYSEEKNPQVMGLLNSKLAFYFLSAINPTVTTPVGDLGKVPFKKIGNLSNNVKNNVYSLIKRHRFDWNSFETSWEFTYLPLLTHYTKQQPTLSASYANTHAQWLSDTQEMQRLEEENNRIFIDAYGLQDELTPDVPLNEITLTCNPHYRYRGDLTEQEREERLQSDTIAELISYAIGCMMGRYSLDREGLVYAHAGNEGFADLVAEGAYQSFAADEDGILPLTGQEWFSDDVTNLVSKFIRTVWGEQHLEENLQFIADSLCLHAIRPRKDERALDAIRRYLSNQFYKDHLSTYKRRPIYWLFSSGKHKAFECLVYLHRYHEGTLARMRTEYVIPLTARINARINRLSEEAEAASTTTERNQINRELKTLQNQQAELATFDEQLRHHADIRISLDLDDGVKENYGKFGNLLAAVKNVTGKAAN